MKIATAMLFDGPCSLLRRIEVPLPEPGPGEALIGVRLATICGSDLHTYSGRRETPCPTVLGHETVGEIVGLPESGPPPDLRIGDRVVWSVAASCGSCFYCGKGLPQKCEHLVKYGHARAEPGTELRGGLATHCHLLRGTTIVRVPNDVPDAVAAPASCATATVAAALSAAEVKPGDRVLIFGGGLLGLTAAAMATTLGAVTELSDPDPARVALATRFGAEAITQTQGAEVVLEMSGANAAVVEALDRVRTGGTVVLVGSVSPSEPVPIVPERIVRRCLKIVGVHNYRPEDLTAAVDFLGRHHRRFPFAELVSATFPLADAEAAFRHAIAEKPIRVGITPTAD